MGIELNSNDYTYFTDKLAVLLNNNNLNVQDMLYQIGALLHIIEKDGIKGKNSIDKAFERLKADGICTNKSNGGGKCNSLMQLKLLIDSVNDILENTLVRYKYLNISLELTDLYCLYDDLESIVDTYTEIIDTDGIGEVYDYIVKTHMVYVIITKLFNTIDLNIGKTFVDIVGYYILLEVHLRGMVGVVCNGLSAVGYMDYINIYENTFKNYDFYTHINKYATNLGVSPISYAVSIIKI